jgi:serine protease Do
VTLGTWSPQAEAADRAQSPSTTEGTGPTGSTGPRLGIGVTPMTPDLASQLGVPSNTQGLVVEAVDPNGAAAQAGIQTGDIIQQVNHQPVRSAEDLAAGLGRSGNRPALLLINRGGQTIFVAIPLGH